MRTNSQANGARYSSGPRAPFPLQSTASDAFNPVVPECVAGAYAALAHLHNERCKPSAELISELMQAGAATVPEDHVTVAPDFEAVRGTLPVRQSLFLPCQLSRVSSSASWLDVR
jgi:hypothetical protein